MYSCISGNNDYASLMAILKDSPICFTSGNKDASLNVKCLATEIIQITNTDYVDAVIDDIITRYQYLLQSIAAVRINCLIIYNILYINILILCLL